MALVEINWPGRFLSEISITGYGIIGLPECIQLCQLEWFRLTFRWSDAAVNSIILASSLSLGYCLRRVGQMNASHEDAFEDTN